MSRLTLLNQYVEPEPDLTPDAVARLRVRLVATASNPSAEEA